MPSRMPARDTGPRCGLTAIGSSHFRGLLVRHMAEVFPNVHPDPGPLAFVRAGSKTA